MNNENYVYWVADDEFRDIVSDERLSAEDLPGYDGDYYIERRAFVDASQAEEAAQKAARNLDTEGIGLDFEVVRYRLKKGTAEEAVAADRQHNHKDFAEFVDEASREVIASVKAECPEARPSSTRPGRQ